MNLYNVMFGVLSESAANTHTVTLPRLFNYIIVSSWPHPPPHWWDRITDPYTATSNPKGSKLNSNSTMLSGNR